MSYFNKRSGENSPDPSFVISTKIIFMNIFNFKWLLILMFISPPVFSQMHYSISSIQFEFTDGEDSFISTVGNPLGIPHDSSDPEFISGLVISQEVSIITGLNESSSDQYTLYPNPINSDLYFNQGTEVISSVIIFDLMGNMVFESKKMNGNSINLERLPSGIYKILLMGNDNKIIQSASILKN